jgi:DNA-binding CsgD family transcriptional regulator
LGLAAAEPGAAVADPLRAGSALLTMLREWTVPSRATVLVIDDAQWGDQVSLRALSYALRRLHDEPVLVVLTARDDGYAHLPSGLLRVINDRGATIELSGFGLDDVGALAERAGVGPLPARAARRLRDHTDGVPLHVREVLHAMPRESLCAALSSPEVALPIPKSLEARVLSGLASCSAQGQRLVAAAAVLGAAGRPRAACRLADAAALADLADPLPALQEAVKAGLLAETTAIDGRCCEFPHASVRAVVYGGIGVSQRAALHRRAARVTSGSRVLAHRIAACPGADARLARDLAEQARTDQAAGKLAEAADGYLAAVRVTGRGAGRDVGADRLLMAAVGLLIDLGETARAQGLTAELTAMAPGAGRSLQLARLAILGGDHRAAERWLTDAWAVRKGPDVAAAAWELALALLASKHTAAAEAWARRAADRAVGIPRAGAHAVLASCLALAGRADDGLALLRAELDRRSADDPGRPLLLAGLGTILLWCEDLPAAARQLATAEAAAPQRPPHLRHLLGASVQRVLADYRLGAWDEAADGAARLVTLASDLDLEWLLGSAHAAAVYPAAGRGRWDAAQGHADAAARYLPADSLALVNARAALAFARDDPDAVLAAVCPIAADLARYADTEPALLGCWPLYAHALARTGRPAEAARVLAPFAQLATARRRRSAIAIAARVRGLIEAAARRPEAARDAYQAAIASLDSLGMPFEKALARLDYGRFLRHLGQRRAALRELCTARAVFAGLGAAPFVSLCDIELGHDTPVTQVTPLTARQLAVARAIATGKTNQQVARDLYITVKTVEYHVSQIFTRLGVDARADIAGALLAPGG